MPSAYTGKILCVDLSREEIREKALPEDYYRQYLGGNGLGVRLLYEWMGAQVDPLGPSNWLGFLPGLLTGYPVPGTGRFIMVGKSPLTSGWGEANSGGTFGPELKTAGYDGVFFSGIAREPVYLLIRDGHATLESASALWGKDTFATEDMIHEMTGESRLKIASIGPPGEKQRLSAGIVNEKGRIAARNGLGAVMGSKLLKAVAVKGGLKKMVAANPEQLGAARRQFLTQLKNNEFAKGLTGGGTASFVSFLVSIGDSPLKNWRLSGVEALPNVANLDGDKMERWKRSSYGCYACTIRCGAIIDAKEDLCGVSEEMHRPEYESLGSFGPLLMNDDQSVAIKAIDLCNRYGIDVITVGNTIALAMECYERGLLTREDTDGLDLSWGNGEAIVALVEKIGRSEGFGAVLADGLQKAAERIGKGAEQYAVGIRGKGLPLHDPRMSPALGTAMITDANPANHTDYSITAMLEQGGKIGNDPALQSPEVPFTAFDQKGPMYALGFSLQQLLNAAGFCLFYTLNSPPPPTPELISSVTGWDFGWEEALRAGRRILTLRQAFNAREGLTPDQFELPKRIREEPLTTGALANAEIDFDALKRGYFAEMGWNLVTGKPENNTLSRLGLAELAQDL